MASDFKVHLFMYSIGTKWVRNRHSPTSRIRSQLHIMRRWMSAVAGNLGRTAHRSPAPGDGAILGKQNVLGTRTIRVAQRYDSSRKDTIVPLNPELPSLGIEPWVLISLGRTDAQQRAA
eukprot:1396756-Rhodomonas_salina.2